MTKAGLPLVVAAMLALTGTAEAAEAPSGSYRYSFSTVLIPDPVVIGERNTGKGDAWFTGKASPHRIVRPLTDVTIQENGIVVRSGTDLAVAVAPQLIACTFDSPLKFRMGMSRICLIDMDGDRVPDHWFRRADSVDFNPRTGRISLDDIHPISPVRVEEVSDLSTVKARSFFTVGLWQGQVVLCLGIGISNYSTCTAQGLGSKPTQADQEVRPMGGTFRYRLEGKDQVRLTTVTPPQPRPFEQWYR